MRQDCCIAIGDHHDKGWATNKRSSANSVNLYKMYLLSAS